jgi:hypothetical protein
LKQWLEIDLGGDKVSQAIRLGWRCGFLCREIRATEKSSPAAGSESLCGYRAVNGAMGMSGGLCRLTRQRLSAYCRAIHDFFLLP